MHLNNGFIPAYTRNDFTDKLHDSFGFRTDYEILSKASMRNIISQSKKGNITTFSIQNQAPAFHYISMDCGRLRFC